jgi:hypothetical protein
LFQFGSAGSGGPNSSVTSSLVLNFISPNSCQVDDSSWPAQSRNTNSYWFATSSPTSARHAASASARMSRSQVSPAGQPAPRCMLASMPYSWLLPGTWYAPYAARSMPNRPPESSIQYSWMVWPRLSLPGVLRKFL